MYYFAFASNLLHAQMAARCPDSKFIGAAKLENYKLIFDGYHERRKGPVANIIPTKGEQVWGGVYEITDADLKLLDEFEIYPKLYIRKIVHVKMLSDGKIHDAITYCHSPQKLGQPSKEYMAVIEAGMKDCGIPI